MKQRKTRILQICLLLLVVVLLLAGCNSKKTASPHPFFHNVAEKCYKFYVVYAEDKSTYYLLQDTMTLSNAKLMEEFINILVEERERGVLGMGVLEAYGVKDTPGADPALLDLLSDYDLKLVGVNISETPETFGYAIYTKDDSWVIVSDSSTILAGGKTYGQSITAIVKDLHNQFKSYNNVWKHTAEPGKTPVE